MNDEQLFLANAYLDGELTVDERAIAEADPAVMAEVEQLRVLQARMRAVEPPSAAARERAIAAAMAEFAPASAPVSAAAPAAVAASRPARTPFWSRPAQRRYLAIAAAVVAVGALGMIVSQFGRGGGDEDAAEPAAGSDLADEAESAAASAQAETARDGDAGTEEATAESADSATEMMAESIEESGGGEETAPAADVAEEAGDATTESSAEATTEAPPFAPALPDFDPEAPVSSPLELGAFGRYLLDEEAADRLGATPNTACPAELNILGETTLVDDPNSVDVYVGVLEAERTVLAIDREACDVIVATPLTEPTEP